MNESELLGSTISEYRTLMNPEESHKGNASKPAEIISNLIATHDWTPNGAEELVSLVNNYGIFMLSNALALAIVLNKEDGKLGF